MPSHSKMLVFPDLHTFHDQVEEIVAKVEPQTTVFLGDYFDQLQDTPGQNAETARWLRESVRQPNRVHLFGNHDLHYAFPGKYTFCSGFSLLKHAAITSVLKPAHWQRMKFYLVKGGFLFTHAGLHRSFFREGRKHLAVFLRMTQRDALDRLRAGRNHPSFAAGLSRGGSQVHGGLTWCDWNEFEPIPGVNQIFGHTPDWEPRVRETSDSVNVCLDTTMPLVENIRHYAIITGGEVEIHAI